MCVAAPVMSEARQNTLSLYFLCANSHRCAVGLPDAVLFLAKPAVIVLVFFPERTAVCTSQINAASETVSKCSDYYVI